MNKDQVQLSLRHAGSVQRFHTWPMHHRASNAEHTWQVMRVHLQVFGQMRPEMWEYLLLHDMPEMATGDIPHGAKRDNPVLKQEVQASEQRWLRDIGIKMPEIFHWEHLRFKACDLLELIEAAYTDLRMGNLFAEPVINVGKVALEKITKEMIEPQDARNVREWLSRVETNQTSGPGLPHRDLGEGRGVDGDVLAGQSAEGDQGWGPVGSRRTGNVVSPKPASAG